MLIATLPVYASLFYARNVISKKVVAAASFILPFRLAIEIKLKLKD